MAWRSLVVINCILDICSARWKQGGGWLKMRGGGCRMKERYGAYLFNSILDCSCVRQYTRIFAQYCDLRAVLTLEDHIL